MWRTLQDAHIAEDFLNMTLTAQNMSASIDKWDLMQLKWVCAGKEISQEKRLPTDLEKMFASCISNTGRIPRLNKEKNLYNIKKIFKNRTIRYNAEQRVLKRTTF